MCVCAGAHTYSTYTSVAVTEEDSGEGRKGEKKKCPASNDVGCVVAGRNEASAEVLPRCLSTVAAGGGNDDDDDDD